VDENPRAVHLIMIHSQGVRHRFTTDFMTSG
jgi:hypothetical protein